MINTRYLYKAILGSTIFVIARQKKFLQWLRVLPSLGLRPHSSPSFVGWTRLTHKHLPPVRLSPQLLPLFLTLVYPYLCQTHLKTNINLLSLFILFLTCTFWFIEKFVYIVFCFFLLKSPVKPLHPPTYINEILIFLSLAVL